jgi:hypothetical protein
MSIWGCSSPATYCQPGAVADFIYCRSQEWALHSPSLAGFVYLEFSWTHAPFVFSSRQPYRQLQSCFLFRVRVGRCPPPLSSGACHTLAAVTSLPLSKHTGRGGATHAFSSQLVYLKFEWGVLLPHSTELRVPRPLCYIFFFFFPLLVYCWVWFFFSFFPGWGVSLSSRLGAGVWWSLFLHLTWSGDAMRGLGCGGVGVLPLLGGFSCKAYLQCVSKILL